MVTTLQTHQPCSQQQNVWALRIFLESFNVLATVNPFGITRFYITYCSSLMVIMTDRPGQQWTWEQNIGVSGQTGGC